MSDQETTTSISGARQTQRNGPIMIGCSPPPAASRPLCLLTTGNDNVLTNWRVPPTREIAQRDSPRVDDQCLSHVLAARARAIGIFSSALPLAYAKFAFAESLPIAHTVWWDNPSLRRSGPHRSSDRMRTPSSRQVSTGPGLPIGPPSSKRATSRRLRVCSPVMEPQPPR